MTTTPSPIHVIQGKVRAGRSDKFYRIYVTDRRWITHYGRNGELGTLGKLQTEADHETALAAARKQYEKKSRASGYRTDYVGEIVLETDSVDLGDPRRVAEVVDSLIDGLADPDHDWDLGASATRTVVEVPVAQTLPDVTAQAAAALSAALPWQKAVPTDLKQADPLVPMLAGVVPEDEITDRMLDKTVLAQRKYDGDRVLIEILDGQVSVLNRQGLPKVRNISTAHTTPFTALHTGRWVLDGEVVGRTLVLFDAVVMTDASTTWVDPLMTPFHQRYLALEVLLGVLGTAADVVLAPVADDMVTLGAKFDLLAEAVTQGHEGIILRDQGGLYEQGIRSTSMVKHKLVKDVDVVITSLHASKSSATLSVHDANGSLREIGAASTIGKGPVSIGDVWTVTYLYVIDSEDPRLYQPRLVRPRTDKAALECSIDQLAGAQTDKSI